METLLQAVVIGLIQGLTEFLPISSSAHLILVPKVLGWNDPFINSPAFDVMLHMGTLAALLETRQQPDGSVTLPPALTPYFGADRFGGG